MGLALGWIICLIHSIASGKTVFQERLRDRFQLLAEVVGVFHPVGTGGMEQWLVMGRFGVAFFVGQHSLEKLFVNSFLSRRD